MSEFWTRWHITLGSWFKEYVYIPLGGNRKGTIRLMINLFVVWFLTGFWHGAEYNFIMWGLYFFLLIGIEKLFLLTYLNTYPLLSRLYFIPLILISWAIFSFTDSVMLQNYIVSLFSFSRGNEWLYYLQNYGFLLVLCFAFSTPVVNKMFKRIKMAYVQDGLVYISFLLVIAYLVDSTYNPFLYFRF